MYRVESTLEVLCKKFIEIQIELKFKFCLSIVSVSVSDPQRKWVGVTLMQKEELNWMLKMERGKREEADRKKVNWAPSFCRKSCVELSWVWWWHLPFPVCRLAHSTNNLNYLFDFLSLNWDWVWDFYPCIHYPCMYLSTKNLQSRI